MTRLSRPVKLSAVTQQLLVTQDATTKCDITWQAVGACVITAVVAFSVGVFALGVEQA